MGHSTPPEKLTGLAIQAPDLQRAATPLPCHHWSPPSVSSISGPSFPPPMLPTTPSHPSRVRRCSPEPRQATMLIGNTGMLPGTGKASTLIIAPILPRHRAIDTMPGRCASPPSCSVNSCYCTPAIGELTACVSSIVSCMARAHPRAANKPARLAWLLARPGAIPFQFSRVIPICFKLPKFISNSFLAQIS
jgi:hypothetical protein